MESGCCKSDGSTVEAELIRTAKFAIIVSQLNAYLPLSDVNGQLVMKYFSFPFILRSLFNIFLVLCSAMVGTYFINSTDLATSTTQSFVMSTVAVIGWIFCVRCRVVETWRKNTTREFWLQNVELVTQFSTASSSAVNYTSLDSLFDQIRISLRKSALILILTLACFLVIDPLRLKFYHPSRCEGTGGLPLWIILTETCYNVLIFLHTGHGIWVCFFLKVYSALLEVIGSKLSSLCAFHEGGTHLLPMLPDELKGEVSNCYNLYLRLEDQIKDFNHHFGTFLVWDWLFSILHLVYFSFLVITAGIELHFVSAGIVAFGVVIFARNLYAQGTEGSRLTGAASGVLTNLHKLYALRKASLDFELRQDLQIFIALITSNMPKVDAAQYFALNRNMIKAVTELMMNPRDECRDVNLMANESFLVYRSLPQSQHI